MTKIERQNAPHSSSKASVPSVRDTTAAATRKDKTTSFTEDGGWKDARLLAQMEKPEKKEKTSATDEKPEGKIAHYVYTYKYEVWATQSSKVYDLAKSTGIKNPRSEGVKGVYVYIIVRVKKTKGEELLLKDLERDHKKNIIDRTVQYTPFTTRKIVGWESHDRTDGTVDIGGSEIVSLESSVAIRDTTANSPNQKNAFKILYGVGSTSAEDSNYKPKLLKIRPVEKRDFEQLKKALSLGPLPTRGK